MIDCKKIFVDTAPFIYYIEENDDNPQYVGLLKNFFVHCYDSDVVLITSTITMEEYCVKPYRDMQTERITLFRQFLKSIGVDVVSIDESIADKAARIRAKHRHFKPMDALQLAAACITGCGLFLTNDKQLRQFGEIDVVLIDELKCFFPKKE